MTTQPLRIELEAQIVRRLQRMDYDLLVELEAATQRAESISLQRVIAATKPEEANVDVAPPSALTRRQLLTRLAIGGSVLATAGYAATRLERPVEERDEGMRSEMAHLHTLLSLYEMMDRVGLDRLITTALAALGFSISGLRLGATAVRGAVEFITALINRFDAAVPQILAGIEVAEGFLQAIDRHLNELERLIGEVMQEAAPLTQAVDRFVQELLGYLPFGIGDRIRRTIQEMAALVGLLPAGLGALRSGLFSPIRAWFPAEEGADLRAQLFTPARAELLEPTRALLNDLIQFADRWDSEMAGPVEAALAQRAEVRSQIVAYQQQLDLPDQRISKS
ncbi:MAG: hypothetical protein KF893_18835 [Caldilineaceae bacterium]|nr:hypothetical protein [Caldilineaceae bacterium]